MTACPSATRAGAAPSSPPADPGPSRPPRTRSPLFDLARETDDEELRRLLRDNPLEGSIRLGLECEPNFFAAGAVHGDLHQVVVAREEGSQRLLGMGGRAVLAAWVNGRATRLGYLGHLRLDRGCRGRTGLLKSGYRRLRELHGDGATPFYLTTIVVDNRPARRLLEAGLRGLPTYRELEPFVTLALPVARRRAPRRTSPRVERAAAGDLEAIAGCLRRNAPRYQFAPLWTPADLVSERRCRGLRPEDFHLARRHGRLTGCLAVWDQRGFKQTVVRGYGRTLRLARPLINRLAPWLGVPRLPSPGGEVRSAFVSHLGVDEDEPGMLLTLLEAARIDAADRELDYLILGLARRHPLLPAVRRAFPHREYTSMIYLVHWEDGAAAAAAVDGRVPHLEVAIL